MDIREVEEEKTSGEVVVVDYLETQGEMKIL